MEYLGPNCLQERGFVKIKPSRNCKITLLFTDVGVSCASAIFNVANMSFDPIGDNKILSKISEFTVSAYNK